MKHASQKTSPRVAAGRQAKRKTRKDRVVATLLFDSFQSSRSGVRGSSAGTRHLLYEAAGISIELSLDSLPSTGDVLLTGQVVQPGETLAGMREMPVQLLHGRKTIAQTQTNSFGEFHLKGGAGKGMQVAVGLSEQKDVFILLDDAIWKRPVPVGA